jgi:hypothetical protein
MKALWADARRRLGNLTDAQMMTALFGAALIVRALAAWRYASLGAHEQIWEYGIQGLCAASTHGDLCMWRDGDAYVSALMPPLTSYLWRALFAAFGYHGGLVAYLTLNVLAGAAGAPLLYAFARAARTTRPAALLAGLGICFYPTFILVAASYHATNFTVALMLAGAIPLVLALENRSWRLALLAGALVGLAGMTRNELLLAAACATPLFLWFGRQSFKPALAAAAAFAFGVGAVLTPWVVRNEVEFARFIPGGNQAGYNLWIGFGPYARGSGRQLDHDPAARAAAESVRRSVPVGGDRRGDRYEDRVQAAFAAEARKTMTQGGVARLASLTAQKATLLALFDWTDPLTHTPFYWGPWLVANLLAWFAVMQLLRGRGPALDPRGLAVMAVFIASMALAYAITGIFSRYRMNIEPFELVFAAMGAWALLARFSPPSAPRTTAAFV